MTTPRPAIAGESRGAFRRIAGSIAGCGIDPAIRPLLRKGIESRGAIHFRAPGITTQTLAKRLLATLGG